MNTGLTILNLGALVMAWRRGASITSMDFSAFAACLGAVTLWFIIAFDGMIRGKQATIDSALEEQQADTRMKQVMVEKIESGQLEMSVSAIRQPRAH
jgi:hypothetical protein